MAAAETFYGKRDIEGGSLDWALRLGAGSEHAVAESYVEFGIPTWEGARMSNGCARARRTRCASFAIQELGARGLKLTPEDVWDGVSFVLSMKMREPQFAGQTKEKLSSRESAGIVQA